MSRRDEKHPKIGYYSQQFAKRLFARHPGWKAYADRYSEGDPELPEYFLEVTIPSANPQVVEPLIIRTCSKEIVSKWMEQWHAHIFPGPTQSMEAHYEEALETIDLFVSDQYLFANRYKDGACLGGWGGMAGAMPKEYLQPQHGQTTVVRSWRGTYDREF